MEPVERKPLEVSDILFNARLCWTFLKEAFEDHIWTFALVFPLTMIGSPGTFLVKIEVGLVVAVVLSIFYVLLCASVYKLKRVYSKKANLFLAKLEKADQARYMANILYTAWDE